MSQPVTSSSLGQTGIRLLAPPVRRPPVLDDAQRAVVAHAAAAGAGPLLVLAGPGTGKTTTVVEAVVARVAAGTPPDRVLALTFSRKAAAELRSRIAARVASTTSGQIGWTFHSFSLGVLQAWATSVGADPPQVLTGPEQDRIVRDLLTGQRLGEGVVRWPEEFTAALGTRGFATALRGLLARGRSLGLEPEGLRRLARELPAADGWHSAAGFFDEYLAVLDAMGVLDYSELVHRAATMVEQGAGPIDLRQRFDLVVVDEYQDTDPGQERLVAGLVSGGADLVVVGDPDQSIYAFRGAEVGGLLQFRDRFRRRDGRPADATALRVCRRSGPVLLAASRAVAARLPVAGAGLAELLHDHRNLTPAADLPAGQVQVSSCATPALQWAVVADLLRREHAEAGTAWEQMAVLVRSGTRSIPAVLRGLGAAGVPVAVAADEVPLAAEPAVAPLLTAARCALRRGGLDVDDVALLLASPLIGADVSALRRLGRLLRRLDREATGRPARPSAELLAEAVADPRELATLDRSIVWPLQRLVDLLQRGRAAAGGSAHDLLWALWSATGWPQRLAAAAAGDGPAARAANRDLDAICALFDSAARDAELTPHRSAGAYLESLAGQEIPAGPDAERAARPGGVRVMTAHRSKGLEWDVVAVVDVQEELWPDIRPRSPLLAADRLTSRGVDVPPSPAALLAEERRLFYVAVTRARRRLLVTAVDSPQDDGVRPSRFLAELGVAVQQVRRRPGRALTPAALTAELRSVAADPGADATLREIAADRLALLAAARAGDRAVFDSADPARWWGVNDLTDPGAPVFDVAEPLRLSASTVSGISDCSLRWFLEHEVRAGGPGTQAQGFGKVVHALAAEVAGGRLSGDPGELDRLLGEVWHALGFPADWIAERERTAARDALRRFCDWHTATAAEGRRLLAAEQQYVVETEIAGRTVRMRGAVDRLEVDVDGRAVLVDLKTGKGVPTEAEVARHVQLGVYRWAVRQGAFESLVGTDPQPAAAELVHLRREVRGRAKVQRQPAAGTESDFADELIAASVAAMDDEEFIARPNRYCDICAQRINCPLRDEGAQVVT